MPTTISGGTPYSSSAIASHFSLALPERDAGADADRLDEARPIGRPVLGRAGRRRHDEARHVRHEARLLERGPHPRRIEPAPLGQRIGERHHVGAAAVGDEVGNAVVADRDLPCACASSSSSRRAAADRPRPTSAVRRQGSPPPRRGCRRRGSARGESGNGASPRLSGEQAAQAPRLGGEATRQARRPDGSPAPGRSAAPRAHRAPPPAARPAAPRRSRTRAARVRGASCGAAAMPSERSARFRRSSWRTHGSIAVPVEPGPAGAGERQRARACRSAAAPGPASRARRSRGSSAHRAAGRGCS